MIKKNNLTVCADVIGHRGKAVFWLTLFLFDPHVQAQPMRKGGSPDCQRPVENWANRPQQKSIVSLNGRERLAAACFVLPQPEFLLSTIRLCCTIIWTWGLGGGLQYKREMRRQLSLTWSWRRKTVFINKRCEVTGLREIMLHRVQICVMQGGPLMTGGGGQLLFIRGVVILQVGLGLVRGLGILR